VTTAGSALVCKAAAPATTCVPNTTYTSGGNFAIGLMAPGDSYVVVFQAPVKNLLRDRPAITNVVKVNSPTTDDPTFAANDPTPGNNTSNLATDTVITVPDAPTLNFAEPDNSKIAVEWTPGNNGTPSGDGGNGGSSITKWVVLVRTTSPATLKIYERTPAQVTSNGSTLTTFVPGGITGDPSLSNGTAYNVTVAARNLAGDSFESNMKTATPCLTCVATLIPNSGTITFTNQGTSVSTSASAQCFPGSQDASKPGATKSDTVVSCYKLTNLSSKSNLIAALREAASSTTDCGGSNCVADQVSIGVTPPTGSTPVPAEHSVVYDKTVSTQPIGDICNATPCGSKVIYKVYLNGTLIGTSLSSTWCGASPPLGSNQPCIISYVHINTSVNPSKVNGNTPNGKEGNGDLLLRVRELVDGTISTCCKR
jgi:hypothetical protein